MYVTFIQKVAFTFDEQYYIAYFEYFEGLTHSQI